MTKKYIIEDNSTTTGYITNTFLGSICASCAGTFIEEGFEDVYSDYLLLLDMGADIKSHLCDKIKTGEEIECDCECTL